MILFAWFVVSRWMSDRQQVAHATPAWIIPVVGLLDVPLALPSLGLPPMHGLMVFALAGGLFFAVPLFTLVFSRLVFEPPLPVALKPSLLTLVALFAVVYSCRAAWVTPELGSLLPLSGVLVGSQLPARGGEHRCPAVRCSSARACHGCNSNRLADLPRWLSRRCSAERLSACSKGSCEA
jgi:hypothetical protein